MAASTTTRLIEVSRISPPSGSVPDTSIPLTSFDLPWLHSPPVHRLFFYASSNPAGPFIESLKSSLSLTLQHFFTLAATVRYSPGSDEHLEFHFNDGDAVLFTLVESDDDFDQLRSGKGREYITRIHPLVPELCGLFSVQVTVFPGHGICFGVTVHHVVGDGSSIVKFLKSWASACNSGEVVRAPIYDRGLVGNPAIYSSMYNYLVRGRPITLADPPPPSSVSNEGMLASFTLGRDKIAKLKKMVTESRDGEHIQCSTFVVSCAYAWVCHVRVRGYSNNESAHFLFPVDCRRRLEPPVPVAYFGNCIRPCIVEENVGLLMGEDGVVAAAMAIGKAVEGLKEGVMKGAEQWGMRIEAIKPGMLLTVAGSPKLGVYDVDFGWGKPVRVEIPSVQKTGAISLAEAKEDEGGVEIGLALEKDEMAKFGVQFSGLVE